MTDRVHPLSSDFPANPSGAKRQEEQQKKFRKALHESSYKSPTPLPLHHNGYRARRRRCNPCCCCLGWLCSLLIVILLLLGVAALVLYFLLQPKAPNFSVTDAHISVFNVTDKPSVQSAAADADASQYLQSDVNFTVDAGNPNKKIGIYYDEINVLLYYQGTEIGQGSLPSFYLGHRDTQQLQLEMKGQDAPLTEAIASSLRTTVASESSIWLQVESVTKARIKIGSWKSRDSKLKVNCDVEISSPIAGRSTQLLSKSCKLKIVSIRL